MPNRDDVRRSNESDPHGEGDKLSHRWATILLGAGLASATAGTAGGPVAALTVGLIALGTLSMIIK